MNLNNLPAVLIVEDDKNLVLILKKILEREGFVIEEANNLREARSKFYQYEYDTIIVDLKLPDGNGFELIKEFKSAKDMIPIIVITAFSDWSSAVEAMRLGAFYYIRKPFDNVDVIETLKRSVFQKKVMTSKPADVLPGILIGNSAEMKNVFQVIEKVSKTDATVLIVGESGTGKELIARVIHLLSSRADRHFIPVNCGAFTETLLNSELFGHRKGAFTGAISDKIGLFQMADKGTLFLDEISELSSQTQVNLLRVLETKEFVPLGSNSICKVDVRLICATNKSLEEQVLKGSFREDLYYRLNVVTIEVPPLRNRRDDIILLAGYFLNKYNAKLGRNIRDFDKRALEFMYAYNWPGNVRELENAVQRAVVLSNKDRIGIDDLGLKISEPVIPKNGIALEEELANIEKSYLLRAMEMSGGNITEAAKLLGISFRAMRYKLKKYGIKSDKLPMQ